MFGAFMPFLKKLFEGRHENGYTPSSPDGRYVIRFDKSGISSAPPQGKVLFIAWEEVRCIAIETNGAGPWDDDVWWLFESEEARIAFPQDAVGGEELFGELDGRYPGFNYEAAISAMSCTSNARFVCWSLAT